MADDVYQLMQQLQQQNKLQRQKYGSIEPYTNPKMKRVKNIADMLQAFGLARTPRDAFRMANKMNTARDTVGEFLPGTSYELAKERNDKLGQGLAMIDLIPAGGLLTAPVKAAKKAKGIGLLDDGSKALPSPKNKTIYHATDTKFDEFDVNKTADGSIWFSDNKKMIEAGYDGVGKRKYTIERLIDEDKLKLANWDDVDKYGTPELIEMGFDGVKYTEAGKKDVTYQIFNPEKLSKLVNKKAKGTGLLDEKSKDLLEEFSLSGGAKIDNVGNVTLYHRTNKQAADKIKETGEMIGKEDRLYFSTKPDGAIKGYGEELVEVKIPINKLDLEDVFSDEIHVTLSSNFKPQQIQVIQKPKGTTTLYHGSAKPIKNINSDQTLYMTENRKVADLYTDPGYSAAVKSKENFKNLSPTIIKSEVKTDKLFDTRIPEHKKLFEKGFYGKYGNMSPLTEKGLPDWLETEDIIDFIKDKKLPFKGVLVDEGGYYNELGKVVDRGIGYAIFDSSLLTNTKKIK